MPTRGKGTLIWQPNTNFYSNALIDGEPFFLSLRANCPHDPEQYGSIQIPSQGWVDLQKNYKYVKCVYSTLTALVRSSLRTPPEKPSPPNQGYLFSNDWRMYSWCDSNMTPHWTTEAEIQRLPGVKRYVMKSAPPVYVPAAAPGFAPTRTVTRRIKLTCTPMAIDGTMFSPGGAGASGIPITPAAYWSVTSSAVADDMMPLMRVYFHMACFAKGPDATWDVEFTDIKISHKCIFSGRTDYGMLPLGVIDAPDFGEAGPEVDLPDFWDDNRIEETLQPDGTIVTAVIPT